MAQGSIVKKSGSWYAVYRVAGKQKWEKAGPTKRLAEHLLTKRISELHAGIIPVETKILFREFAEKWLADYAKISVKPSTYSSYCDIFRLHLTPHLGHLLLSRVAPVCIQVLVARKLEDGLSPKSVVNMLVPLKEMYRHAREWGYVQHDPTLAVKRPRIEHEEMDFLTHAEIRKFLEAVRPEFHTLFLTAILTGMRRGELLALKWGDIDWQSGQICVRRSLYKGSFVSPKSRNGVRRIIMSDVLAGNLEYDRRLANPEHELVFCTPEGKPLDADNLVKREFHPALERAGIRRIRFHDLRHTFASLLIANGEDIKFVQSMLGHASATTTLDRYGHLFPGTQRDASRRLDNAVFPTAVRKLLESTESEESGTPRSSIQVLEN